LAASGHPWLLTLEQLVARVRGEFGQPAADCVLLLAYLRGIADDDLLEPETIRSLLVRCALPWEDFGLDPN